MDEHEQGVAINGARAESTSEQGWGKDHCPHCGKPIGDIVPIGAIRDQAHRGRAIIVAVAEHFDKSVGDIVGKRRFRGTARARHIAMYVCYQCTTLNYSDIGKLFGTDHSTVIYALNQTAWWAEHDVKVGNDVRWLVEHCTRRDRTPAVVGGGPG